MKRDEILAMKPGRELDRLVGKHVLGCYVKRQSNRSNSLYTLVIPNGVDSIDWSTEEGAWSGMPPLSTTWEGMRLIDEAMYAKGWMLELSRGGSGYFMASYNRFLNGVLWSNDSENAQELAPHAGALAALLAREATDD